MKHFRLLAVVFSSFVLLQPTTNFAFTQPRMERLPDVDKRAATAEVLPEQNAAAATLRARYQVSGPDTPHLTPGTSVRVAFDQVTGAPKSVTAVEGFLSGPGGKGKTISSGTAAAFAPDDPDLPTKAFLQEHRDLFGHGPEALDGARVKREFVTAHNGMRTVVWQQQVDAIPVFDSLLISHTTRAGELVNVSSGFLPDPVAAADRGVPGWAVFVAGPPVTATAAVVAAARDVGEIISEQNVSEVHSPESAVHRLEGSGAKYQVSGPDTPHLTPGTSLGLAGPVTAGLIWLPMNRDTLRLCWEVVLTSRARGEMFRVLIDAQTSEVLLRRCLTEYISNASYRVYTSDSPSPFSPGHPTPLSAQPPLVARVLVVTNAFDTNASPNGWMDDGINETRGNNVDAHADRNNDNAADLPRPQGAPFRVFDFSLDLAQAPGASSNAAIVQLFFLCNWYHDRLYELGFTEAAGNFQNNNFGRGGLGNDAVQADAQDGAGLSPPNVNNANFSTPSDGSAGRMQMYVFDGPTPDRDGDLDAEIIFHEHTHGLSNRRVGGGAGISALQTRGMGEGWSDFYGLALLSEAGDNVNGNYAAGGYATYQLSGLTQNYYFGIRRYPYSTDMTKNPLTFRDIDPPQASSHTGIPRSSIIGSTADEVHNQGEVWCVTLWDARANLVNRYGWAVGNELILQLVTDGMNLSPVNPNFLQARDAILQADLVDTGGANRNELWAAFAKRGMGASATSPASSATTGLVETYDVPDNLLITPATALGANGPVGGPFNPNPSSFILTNVSSSNLNWSLMNTSTWITATPNSGTLAAGGPATTVNVTIQAAANSFALGSYTARIRFTNQTSGVVQSRSFVLNVIGRSMFDDFDPGVDLSQWSAFGGVVGSTVLATNHGGFLSPPNSLWFGDGGSRFATTIPIDTSGGGTINFSIRLANGTSSPWEQVDSLPAEGCVLESSVNGGASWNILGSYDTTFYYNWTPVTMAIPSIAQSPATQFRWRQKSHSGSGFDHWALEDVTVDAQPAATLTLTIPATATEGDAPLNGIVTASPAPSSDLTVTLNSSDTSEVTVPPAVTILAGQSDATFALTIEDDAILDGSQSVTIRASETQHQSGNGLITVQDNETATLAVDVPANVTEGLGGTTGVVSVSAAPGSDVQVDLNSSDTTEIQVPTTIFIPAGQTSAVFNVTVVNDTEIDGPQTAIVTAHVVNWTDGTGSITVQDNETFDLSVTIPASASETDGVLIGAGQVFLTGTLPMDLEVSLLSSDLTEALVPATATILAGQTNTAFDITIVDDSQVDGAQSVTITASAPGFNSGSNSMTVLDDESPPVPLNPIPPDQATNVLRNAALSWSNSGSPNITNDVYFGTNPTPGPGEFLGSTTSTTWSLPLLWPGATYYWQIVARRVGQTAGPIWRFTTRGVDHFDWDTIASPQLVGTPFPVTVTARDELGTVVSNFTGAVALRGATAGSQPSISNLVIETGASLSGSVRTVLDNLGRPYDFVQTSVFSSLNLSNYSTVILGMDGGSVAYADMASLAAAVNAGTKLILLGGSQFLPFAQGLNDFFIRINTNNYNWATVIGTPDLTVTTPSHPLATGIPPTYSFFNHSASYYMARVTDGAATTVATNGDGFACLTTKPVGQGVIVLFINSAAGTYYSSPADFNVLSAVISNAFQWVEAGGSVPVAITPTNSGSFANGAWTGNITILQPVTNMSLVATDNNGHRGTSNPFEVLLADDLSVSVVDQPDPAVVGGYLTNTITVANSGPSLATGVTATNFLPGSVTFVSATASQGSCVLVGGRVECALGSLAGGSAATITVVVTPGVAGQITNLVTVGRAEADIYAGNNSAETVTTALMPALDIADASVVEGNSGTTNMLFTVTLLPPPVLPVTVSYATSDGTAQAGSDYVATNGGLNFGPGQTNAVIAVTILGETNTESHETFSVILSNAVSAVINRAVATGTVLDDDRPLIGVFDDPLYVDTTSGGNGAESDNVQASLTNLGFGVVTFTNITEAASNYSRLLFPELETGNLAAALTAAQKAALSNAVGSGATLIVHGSTGARAAALLNALFNWSVVETTGSGIYTRTNGATGTEFADDPATLPALSATTTLQTSSLPTGARSIYEAGGQSAVALLKRGNGLVIFLGWDWFDALPLGTTNGGWLMVLNSAALQQPLKPAPLIVANGSALVSESCSPGNGVIDPDELVTVKLSLSNIGDLASTNLTATLLPTGGATAPSGPQNYGVIVPGGATVSNTFSLIATGVCGGTLTAMLQLQDGTNDLGTVPFTFRLGVSTATLAQSFDGVSAPTLPAGWTATLSGAGSPWTTSTAQRDTVPNAAFAPDPSSTCDNWLTSPSFFFPTNGGQLTFRHIYSTESCCDGGWLQISIAGGGFTDILTAGGSFVTNGYPTGNGWRGISPGYPNFITTIANLPASALGRNIQLRWRFTADSSVSGAGWYVDTISVGGSYTCCVAPPAPTIVIPPADLTTTVGGNANFSVTANGSPPLYYQWQKNNVSLAGRTGQTLALTGVTTNDAADYSVVVSNFVGTVTSAKARLTVLVPDGGTVFSNAVPISIPSVGAASVYPSTIVLSNLAGTVSKVTVTLSNLSHTYPDDLDILLVGPTGTNVMLMSDAGGSGDLQATSLSFDDEASNALPDSDQIFPGAYRPTDYVTGDVLPAPAPAAPFGTTLAAFTGTDPNGLWKLFVSDDAAGDAGSINNGWSLRLTLNSPNSLVFLPPVLSGGQILLRFATLPGQSYTVQYKNSLKETTWQTLQTVVGDGTILTVPDLVTASSTRFYRLQQP